MQGGLLSLKTGDLAHIFYPLRKFPPNNLDKKGKAMSITREELAHYALLARIELDEDKLDMFLKQFNETLEQCDKIFEVDTEGVEPFISPASAVNVLREDVVKPGLAIEDVLKNAPASEDRAFLVPQIIGQGGDQ